MNIKETLSVYEDKLGDFFANIMMKVRAQHPEKKPLVSEEQQRAAFKQQVKEQIHDYESAIVRGWELLLGKLRERNPKLLEGVKSLDKDKFTELITSNPEEAAKKINEGVPVWQLVGLSQEFIDALHHEAVELYTKGQFDQASDAFLTLIVLNNWDQRCWLGYGLSEQFGPKKNIHGALDVYSMAIGLDKTNPYPYIYYAEGLAELGDAKVAKEYLDLALEQAQKSDTYAGLIQQIKELKAKYNKF